MTLLLFAGTAEANTFPVPFSVQLLQFLCKQKDDGICQAYIEGVGDMMMMNGKEMKISSDGKSWAWMSMCSDQWPSKEAMRNAFLVWAKEHPENTNGGALMGVWFALARKWPCPSP